VVTSSVPFRWRLEDLGHRARRAIHNNTWLVPVAAAVLGVILALLVRSVEDVSDPGAWGVTVDRARDTMLASLAIVFTGLSIVLALAASIYQNAASRFSMRWLVINQYRFGGRMVVGVFAMTAAYTITVQWSLRYLAPDDPAPQGAMTVAVILVVLSGATIIWYITTALWSLRLDRILRSVSQFLRRTLRRIEAAHRNEVPAPLSMLEAPEGAQPIWAFRSGYVADVDLGGLLGIAERSGDTIGVTVRTGDLVIKGQQIGWAAPGAASSHAEVGHALDIVCARDPARDVAYSLQILVDAAVMALSPAINDPETAVEVVNELTVMLVQLDELDPGPRAKSTAQGDPWSYGRRGHSLTMPKASCSPSFFTAQEIRRWWQPCLVWSRSSTRRLPRMTISESSKRWPTA